MHQNDFELDNELFVGGAGGDINAYCNDIVKYGDAWDFEDLFAEPCEASGQSPEASPDVDLGVVSTETQDLDVIQNIDWSTFIDFVASEDLQGPSIDLSALEMTSRKRGASQIDLDELPSKKSRPMTPSLISTPSSTFTSSPAAKTPSPSPPPKKATPKQRAKRAPKKPAKSKSPPPPPAPRAERSMAELYAAKFVSLTHEEKRRILLPLINGNDPVTGMKLAAQDPLTVAPSTPPPSSPPAFDTATYSFDTAPTDSPSSPLGPDLGPTASAGPDVSIFDSDDFVNLSAIHEFNANFDKAAAEAAASNSFAFDTTQCNDASAKSTAIDPFAFDTTELDLASVRTVASDAFVFDSTHYGNASAKIATTDPFAFDPTSYGFNAATVEGLGMARQREALEKHTYLKEQGRRR
jgi:hypothetical protein